MGKLKDDFLAGTERQKIKFCANIIEEFSFAGKSKNKIEEELRKIGADKDIISAAYDELGEVNLPSEIEKAGKIIRENFEIPKSASFSGFDDDMDINVIKERQKQIRRILSKLSYLKFDEETLEEIAEGLKSNFFFNN